MKRTVLFTLVVMMLLAALPAQGARRTVFYEHFSQELCSTCPITAAAISQFRNDYSYEDVAIISYWTQGSQALPDANNRGLEFYDDVLTPSVIVDGTIDVPAPPQEYQDFVNAYNAESGISSPCTMMVAENGGGSYTIHIEAESGFSGSLMAVAYEEYLDTHGTTYACFGRQFVIPYSGQNISMNAGETLDVPITVSVGHTGVVAWIHDNSKEADGGSRRFTPWAVLQSADSHSGGTVPTPTPTPTGGNDTPTPTPPSGTPTATPEIPCNDIGCTIDMPSDFFHSGDPFYLNVYLCNVDSVEYEVPLFVILDVAGALFFAPSFSAFDKYDVTLPPNQQILQVVLPEFQWPSNVGSANGLMFYAGMTNPEMSQLFGDLDTATFGWGE